MDCRFEKTKIDMDMIRYVFLIFLRQIYSYLELVKIIN